MLAALATTHLETARAEDNVAARAHDAYERGRIAHGQQRYADAAREFATADALAPDPVAFEMALSSAVAADDALLGRALLDRGHARNATGRLKQWVTTAEQRFAGRTGRVLADCPAQEPCVLLVDGAAVIAGGYVTVGAHVAQLSASGVRREWVLDVKPETVTRLTLHDVKAPKGHGLWPGFFVMGAATTATLGGLSLWAGMTTLGRHDEFVGAGCDRAATPICDGLRERGTDAQFVTNVLISSTVVAAVVTGVFAYLTFARRAEAAR
jgi:hypothetical protein